MYIYMGFHSSMPSFLGNIPLQTVMDRMYHRGTFTKPTPALNWMFFLLLLFALPASLIAATTSPVSEHTGWCPPVTSWFINPTNTIVIAYLCISTINHSFLPLIRQPIAILGAPSCTSIGEKHHEIHGFCLALAPSPKKHRQVMPNSSSLGWKVVVLPLAAGVIC